VSAETFVLAGSSGVGRLVLWLKQLTFKPGRALKVSVEWCDPKGTDAQRAKLRSMERAMAKHCGYKPDELHEALLASRFGTKRIEILKGCFVERPAKRSSDLKKPEMSEYIDWVDGVGREAGAWQ
jgi:hypothetical protein